VGVGSRSVAFLAMAWVVFLALGWLAGRAAGRRRVRPDPATPDRPDDVPPAVVGYLVNGCRVDPDAAVGTLMDLAARRYLDLYQPGDDPEETLVRVRDADSDGLTPFERRMLRWVVDAAGDAGVVPLANLTRGFPRDGRDWPERFAKEVVEDATARGLTKDRPEGLEAVVFLGGLFLGLGIVIWLPVNVFTAGLAPGAGLGTARIVAIVIGMLILLGALFYPGTLPLRWFDVRRRSPAGVVVTARGLALAAWLRAHESFRELPPAAVTAWGRYLSYGAALGLTPVVASAADIAVGARTAAWSRYTGTWRQVRVHYPRRGRVEGGPPLAIAGANLVALGLLAGLVVYGRAWYEREPPLVRYVVLIGLGAFAARRVYRLARALADRLRTVEVTGEVLTRTPSYGGNFVAIDEGRADTTTVWTMWSAWRNTGSCDRGDLVRLRGFPWSRWVRKVIVLEKAATRPSALR
jgi:hypothetical protein